MAVAGGKDMTVPTFRPTWDEFKDFYKYVNSIEAQIKQYGLVKVVPPKEWVPSKNNYNISADYRIHSPIRQIVNGKSGFYQMMNVVETEEMSVEQFWTDSQKLENQRSKRELQSSVAADYEALQRSFWSNITFNPPLYGADSEGTLFDESLPGEHWNVNKLPSLLSQIQERTDTPMPGITRSMLYFGQWKSAFAWHVEDMNLYSINYLHFGQCKQWYTIPPKYATQFERVCQGLFPLQFKRCPEFLRHKEFVVSPAILKRHNIPVHTATQGERDFMITYPQAYHAGFNYGFNCAESVNFATENWLDYGRKAGFCRCSVKYDGAHETDSAVAINMDFVESVLTSLKKEDEQKKAGTWKAKPKKAGDAKDSSSSAAASVKPQVTGPGVAHGMVRKLKKADLDPTLRAQVDTATATAAAASATATAAAGTASVPVTTSNTAATPAAPVAAANTASTSSTAAAAVPSSPAAKPATTPTSATAPVPTTPAAAVASLPKLAIEVRSTSLPVSSAALTPVSAAAAATALAAPSPVSPSPKTPVYPPLPTPTANATVVASPSAGAASTPKTPIVPLPLPPASPASAAAAAAAAAALNNPAAAYSYHALHLTQLQAMQQQALMYAAVQQQQFAAAATAAAAAALAVPQYDTAYSAPPPPAPSTKSASASSASSATSPVALTAVGRSGALSGGGALAWSKPEAPARSSLFASNPIEKPKKLLPMNSKLLRPTATTPQSAKSKSGAPTAAASMLDDDDSQPIQTTAAATAAPTADADGEDDDFTAPPRVVPVAAAAPAPVVVRATAAPPVPTGAHKYPKKKAKKVNTTDSPAGAAASGAKPIVGSGKSSLANVWGKALAATPTTAAADAPAAAAAAARDVIDLTAPASSTPAAASTTPTAAAAVSTPTAVAAGSVPIYSVEQTGSIEAIRRRRFENGRDEFFVKWRFKSEAENTWESYECVSDVVDLLFPSYRQHLNRRKRSQSNKSESAAAGTEPTP